MTTPEEVGRYITNISPDKRVCKLIGSTCVADFDITPESIAPIFQKVLDTMRPVEARMLRHECHMNFGLYDGGKDIRVWAVTYSDEG